MEIDANAVDKSTLHRTLTSIVAPRPIGWISSLSEDGTRNLAPFSYYNGVCTEPPVVMFSVMDRDDGELKDTTRNVLDSGEFVANLVTESLLRQADITADEVPPSTDEFDHAGLAAAESTVVDPPRVAEAVAAMECTVHGSQRVFNATTVFGRVERFHVDDDLCTDGKIDMRKIDAVGRVGGPYYTGIRRLPFERGDRE